MKIKRITIRQKYQMTLVEIDLNMDITSFDIDNEDRQEGEAQMH